MKCPHCQSEKKFGVLDTRLHEEDIARRRECGDCGERFWTREQVDKNLRVSKERSHKEYRRKTPEKQPEAPSNALFKVWK